MVDARQTMHKIAASGGLGNALQQAFQCLRIHPKMRQIEQYFVAIEARTA
jgi:hypothetical protein